MQHNQSDPGEHHKTRSQKLRLRERTGRAWFSHRLRHPARNGAGRLFFQPGAHKASGTPGAAGAGAARVFFCTIFHYKFLLLCLL